MNPKSSFLSHTLIYAVGNIAQRIVGIIMLPIYTQYLSPADYGVIGLLTFLISIVEIVFGAQMVASVPKYFHDAASRAEQNAVVTTGLFITFAFTLFFTGIIATTSDATSIIVFDNNELGLVITLFSVLLVTQAVQEHGLTFIRLEERPWLFTSISLFKLVVQLSLNIWLVVFEKLGILGIAISTAASNLFFALLIMGYTIARTGIHFSPIVAKKMFRFCWPLWIGSLAAIYYGSSNRYFMNHYSSLEDIGFYELATKIATLITILIWQPFNQSWQTERFKVYKNHEKPQDVFFKVFQYVCAILFIACLGISLLAEPVIRVMAAPEFYPAIDAVPILALSCVFSGLGMFCNFSFHIRERTKIISKIHYASAILITPLNFLLIPKYGFIGAAAALCIGTGCQFALSYYAGKKVYDMGLNFRPVAIQLALVVSLFVFFETAISFDSFVLDLLARIVYLVLAVTISASLLMANKEIKNEIYASLALIRNKVFETK